MTAVHQEEEAHASPSSSPGQEGLSTIPLDDTDVSNHSSMIDIESNAPDTPKEEIGSSETEETNSFFLLGLATSLFFSIFSLLGLCLVPDLRRNSTNRRSCFLGFALACFIHAVVAAVIILIIIYTQKNVYIASPTSQL